MNGFPHINRITDEVTNGYQKTMEEIDMKKIIAGILAAALVLSVGIVSAFAAGPDTGRNFVDADNDGVCDLMGSNCAYVDADGDGVCVNCGFRGGRGR